MKYIVVYSRNGDTIRELTPFDTKLDACCRAAFVKRFPGVVRESVKVEEIAEQQASAVPPE